MCAFQMYWKQCKEAFSAQSLEYIASLDPFKDARILRTVGVRDESILTCVISTILLQQCAAQGMTLHEIASMVQRQGMG